MKKNLYTLLLIFITSHAEAQLQKGLFSVGVSPEYWNYDTPESRSTFFKIRERRSGVKLNAQYFFAKNFSAELGLDYSKAINVNNSYYGSAIIQDKNTNKNRGLIIGANYYYPIRKNLYLKTSLNYTFYRTKHIFEHYHPDFYVDSTFNSTAKGKSSALNINANLVYFISKRFTLDLKLGGLTYSNYGDGYNSTLLNFKPSNWSIGVSYYPNAKTEKKKKNVGVDSVANLSDTSKNIQSDTISQPNDNVLKGRTFFFPNGTPLNAGEVYVEPNIIPLETILFIPIVDVGLGKGFSISVAPVFSLLDMQWDDYYLLANLKYARKISSQWSVSANTILWANVYKSRNKTIFDYTLFPTLATTRTGRKSELSFGLGIGLGVNVKTYLANIGYTIKIGRRWAYTTDNLFHINHYDSLTFVSSHTFKYHLNKRLNFDFGILGTYDSEIYPMPLLKASYHFPVKKGKSKIATK